jgi:hypothetical protein
MAIHFISGKPGSGKSLYGVHLLLKEITQGNRNVVTNLPLHPGRLNEYLQERWPNRDFRLLQRLTILTEDEARKFWLHRGDQTTPIGVMYQLDELHLFFNARDWMATGRDCLHYLSQHRKLGDIVIAITQSVPNVDKQFRSVAEDFTVLRNEYTAKFGPFRGRGRFVRKTYLSEPTGGSSQEPFENASFTLDAKGIASCYDTAQGIGIHGNAADKGRRASGWSIWWTIPLGIGLASLAGIIPWFMAKGAAAIVAPDKPGAGAKVAPDRRDGVPPSAVGVGRTGDALSSAGSSTRDYPAPPCQQPVFVSGVIYTRGQINVVLSDGRTLTEEDGELAKVTRSAVILRDGTKLYFKPSLNKDTDERPVIAKSPSERDAGTSLARANPVPTTDPKSSWYTDAYGVQKLKEPEALATTAAGFRAK